MNKKIYLQSIFSGFNGRMLLGMLLINLTLIPLLFASIFLLVGKDYKAQFINYARTQTYLLARHIGENPDKPRIQNILDDLVLSGGTLYAEYELDGSQLKASMLNEDVEFKEDFYFGSEDNNNVYFISVQVADKAGIAHGQLKLGFDELPLVERINSAYLRGMYIAAGYLILTLILVGSFGYFLTQSIRRLRDVTRKIAAGETNAVLSIDSRITEVTDLAQDLEAMRSELVLRAQTISLREEMQRNIVENAAEGIISVNEHYLIQSFNRAAENIFGYTEKEVLNTPFKHLLAHANAYLFDPAMVPQPLLRQELTGLCKPNQEFDLMLSTSRIDSGETPIFTLLAQDISERKELIAKLKHLATHDLLTKLPNRMLFDDVLTQTLFYAKRKGHMTALLFVDLDNFKTINDTFGHEYGDLLLATAATRMGRCIRLEDTLARLGGDEFTIILSEIKQHENAALIAQKILHELSLPFNLHEHQGNTSGSIGIAIYPSDSVTTAGLISHADSAMYQAKKLGGNNYQYYRQL